MRYIYLISVMAFWTTSSQASALFERSVENGSCKGSGGAPGVCIATSKCTADGGKFISGACPGTPDNIKCCTKTSCGSNGNCRFTSQCSGSTLTGLCPGPADFKCCVPGSGGGNGGGTSFPAPKIPAVGACKARSVDAAKAIVKAFPGKVREIGCKRDCGCPGDSEHCCGMATDLMCSSGGGVRTSAGEPIAEWIMHNRKSLHLKYVIWGQKIWNPSRDAVKPWSQWRAMEDRGSNTANHWDHVHVSYE